MCAQVRHHPLSISIFICIFIAYIFLSHRYLHSFTNVAALSGIFFNLAVMCLRSLRGRFGAVGVGSAGIPTGATSVFLPPPPRGCLDLTLEVGAVPLHSTPLVWPGPPRETQASRTNRSSQRVVDLLDGSGDQCQGFIRRALRTSPSG